MDWVKDKNFIEEEELFTYGKKRQELIYELEESTTRKKYRKKKLGNI